MLIKDANQAINIILMGIQEIALKILQQNKVNPQAPNFADEVDKAMKEAAQIYVQAHNYFKNNNKECIDIIAKRIEAQNDNL